MLRRLLLLIQIDWSCKRLFGVVSHLVLPRSWQNIHGRNLLESLGHPMVSQVSTASTNVNLGAPCRAKPLRVSWCLQVPGSCYMYVHALRRYFLCKSSPLWLTYRSMLPIRCIFGTLAEKEWRNRRPRFGPARLAVLWWRWVLAADQWRPWAQDRGILPNLRVQGRPQQQV